MGRGRVSTSQSKLSDAPANGLDALLTEHASERLGPLWLAEITKAARSPSGTTPGSTRNSSTWDEGALNDVVQDVVERMLAKRQVEYICDVANDFGHARALIYRQVKLTCCRRPSSEDIDRQPVRPGEGTSGGPPFEAGIAKPSTWGLADSEIAMAERKAPDRLVTALAALPRLPGLGKDRASAVWTNETLEDALAADPPDAGRVAEAA